MQTSRILAPDPFRSPLETTVVKELDLDVYGYYVTANNQSDCLIQLMIWTGLYLRLSLALLHTHHTLDHVIMYMLMTSLVNKAMEEFEIDTIRTASKNL